MRCDYFPFRINFSRFFIIALICLFVASCDKEDDDIIDDDPIDRPYDPAKDNIVIPRNELRAAWISTVYNLDWPTTKGNVNAQKSELITILDRLQALNMNAVVLQVRPMADAFYPSDLEPWSSYLTGTQGANPGYDPLQFAIEEAHKRGMELHAWLNPYRVAPTSLVLASHHPAVKNPDWVVTYKDMHYYNPGIPEARAHLKDVIRDIIMRYDVDAIHFDDYFYPSGAKSISDPFGFNDKTAFEKYGNGSDVHVWRAENINTMIGEVSQLIRSVKPTVLFGISPSGRRENSIALYADPLIWLENKWVDYLAPQIYWEFGHATADFGTLVNYWNNNSKGVPIVIGIAAYKFNDPSVPAFGDVEEYGRQIERIRSSNNLFGCIFFRAKNLNNATLYSYLKNKYKGKSLAPVMGKTNAPAAPNPVISLSGNKISWDSVPGANRYVVYVLEKDPDKKNTYNAIAIDIIAAASYSCQPGKSYFVTAANNDCAESKPSNVVKN